MPRATANGSCGRGAGGAGSGTASVDSSILISSRHGVGAQGAPWFTATLGTPPEEIGAGGSCGGDAGAPGKKAGQ
ncbi:hypothetical protein GCM10017744_032800 [Streptomyces antimycoticus]|uniref:Uncharacterized protein n=1 Tax=Streptomyces antimycoticus TaxID=68175 RepID=A0A4D4KJ14_9ACTN|nr:hypothetical protein SANT12839_069710 [Streptomyces antimycoticus]